MVLPREIKCEERPKAMFRELSEQWMQAKRPIPDNLLSAIRTLEARVHLHEGVDGGVPMKCGHPVQCMTYGENVSWCSLCAALRDAARLQNTVNDTAEVMALQQKQCQELEAKLHRTKEYYRSKSRIFRFQQWLRKGLNSFLKDEA